MNWELKNIKNHDKIEKLLKKKIIETYEDVKEGKDLLCLECGDIDLYVVVANDVVLEDTLKENFQLDEYGDVIDEQAYKELIFQLYDRFISLYLQSGLFDFFPAGTYFVHGEERTTETDYLTAAGVFYAPFEDALKDNESKS
ncbi:hypothetical protein J9303_10760 [Bacillaceae bacterium Marseille-Q3522]|nr:hypothetical protein [Bacillaceae bacterium Marseille-Q3522]